MYWTHGLYFNFLQIYNFTLQQVAPLEVNLYFFIKLCVGRFILVKIKAIVSIKVYVTFSMLPFGILAKSLC